MKESSGDIRRITEIRHLAGDRIALFVGVDDLVVEAVAAGAVGWIAGLVNAFPHESVRLFRDAREGRYESADELYRWFLPLLQLDTGPKFVQQIKLVQAESGHGNAIVRPPRLELVGQERQKIIDIVRVALAGRTAVSA